jgi:hypothetical protein
VSRRKLDNVARQRHACEWFYGRPISNAEAPYLFWKIIEFFMLTGFPH